MPGAMIEEGAACVGGGGGGGGGGIVLQPTMFGILASQSTFKLDTDLTLVTPRSAN